MDAESLFRDREEDYRDFNNEAYQNDNSYDVDELELLFGGLDKAAQLREETSNFDHNKGRV